MNVYRATSGGGFNSKLSLGRMMAAYPFQACSSISSRSSSRNKMERRRGGMVEVSDATDVI